jgi:adenosylcobinamide-phosphate synthase
MPDILIIAFFLDLIFADPFWLYHPVQLVGNYSDFIEGKLRKCKKISLQTLGVLHWFITVFSFVIIFFVLVTLMALLGKVFVGLLYLYVVFSFLALGSLVREARAIQKLLKLNKITEARERVQRVVSRDMSQADEMQIVRAVIETTTENISDGIIAPLFFFGIGGPLFMLIYKISNTLDSMIGYKNEKYLKYGWFSAKVDDVLNYIPARITGSLIVLVAFLTNDSALGGVKAWVRDAQKGPSPNGGIPIVTYAGVRDIRLGGPCFDKEGGIISIPYVGGQENFDKSEIRRVIFYAYATSFIMLLLTLLINTH